MLDLTKLLPAFIRKTQAWVDVIAVFQQFLDNDARDEIASLRDRFDYDTITDDDAKKIIWGFGHTLSQGDGYTSSHRYIQRQLRTLLKRIEAKGAEPSYQYLFYVYDVIGDVYPTLISPYGYLKPWLTWLVSDETDATPLQLDTGLTLDQNYEGDANWYLDYGAIASVLTRHFILSYSPWHVENSTEFMSVDTVNAFFNDVNRNKRKIEVPHYEFRLYADALASGALTTETWQDYEQTFSVNQESMRIDLGLDLTDAAYIQFGDGRHAVVNNSITGVQSLVQQIPLSFFEIKLQDSTHLYFKHFMQTTTRFFDYQEIAVLDSSNNCLFYSKFPWVRYPSAGFNHAYVFLMLS